MDHPFVVAFIILCAGFCCFLWRARRQRHKRGTSQQPGERHPIQLHLGSSPPGLAAEKPAVESTKRPAFDTIRQRRMRGPLLCDICHTHPAIGYTEGVTGEPDAITVFCRDCGGPGMKMFDRA